MYVELITILVRAKNDITRACRRCQSTLYIVFNIAKVGGPHKKPISTRVKTRTRHVLLTCIMNFTSFTRVRTSETRVLFAGQLKDPILCHLKN